MEKITLDAPSAKGEIYIGKGVAEERLPALTAGGNCFVVTDANVYALYRGLFEKYFEPSFCFVFPAGEESKTPSALLALLEEMVGAGMRRTSKLFAVGGGVTGDLGGLAAALYMRGISCVQIPTTLLAQVDSGVGGKTAVDMCGVKNVIGAFHQPSEVLIDPDFLKTLPAREIKCGLGEIVKYAALNGEIFDALEKAGSSALADEAFLSELTAACVRLKAKLVEEDERDEGVRKSLNLGHTTAHIIELSSPSKLSHGECVLYGMLFETRMAIEAGVCEREYGERLLKIIRRALSVPPVSNPDFSALGEWAEKARMDKKNGADGNIRVIAAESFGEWTELILPFETYRSLLCEAAKFEKERRQVCG